MAALRFDSIEKAFFGVKVLKGISFTLKSGNTLGLVGENGAGKSTLMNILGGNLPFDNGSIELWQERYQPSSPTDAEQAGIAFVHQELNLFGNLSVAENLFINGFPTRAGFIQRKTIREKASKALEQVGLAISPDSPVDRLSAGERQLVEIAKALARNARLIILDEPTTSLTDHEVDHLFRVLQKLKQEGITLIYISHALEEVLDLSDDIVVLRDGEQVEFGAKDTFTKSRMISLMVGRELNKLYPDRNYSGSDKTTLQVNQVSRKGVVKDISFSLRQGEVLGLAGLMGSGRTELARILFGLDPVDSGNILLQGQSLLNLTPKERIANGMAFLTEDRRKEGLCMEASIEDNMILSAAPKFKRGPMAILDYQSTALEVAAQRKAVHLTPEARNEQAVKTLSGGNQQKVVLAKWLLNQPKFFILDEPTRGIDVGAKYEIYRLIHQLTAQGSAVLVISSELEELIGICDRILTLRFGEISGAFNRTDFDRESILEGCLH